MNYKVTKHPRHVDNRGQLAEFLSVNILGRRIFGHIYFVTFTSIGAVRGNHYHKKMGEFFGLVQGKVLVIIKDMKSKKRKRIVLDSKSEQFELLEIGPNICHTVVSLEPNSILVDYYTKPYNSATSDTYKHELVKPKAI